MQAPEVRYAPCGDGTVAWSELGDGPFDLLFVPGFVSHLDLWWEYESSARFFARLASFSRLLVFDKRGTGLSDPLQKPRPLEERFDEIMAVLDAAGTGQAAIVALSEGGVIAMAFAATHPQRVASLVLVNSTPCMRRRDDWPYGWDDEMLARLDEAFARWGDGRSAVRFWCPRLIGKEHAVQGIGRLQRLSSSPAVARGLIETMVRSDVRAVLPAIQAPTLVLHADRDHTLPVEGGRAMAKLIPGARFRAIPSRDHLPWLEGADAALDEIEEFLTGARGAPDPDRVLATVLFADIVGSTMRAAELGDRRWRGLLTGFESAADRAVRRWRGRPVKFMGDGMLATFDGPGRAVSAACELRDAVRELGVDVRCGVHTGECEQVGDDLAGLAVHIGARVGSLAEPGEVLATGTVRDLTAGSGIAWEERGERTLRGVPGEWRLFAAQSPSPSSA